MPLSPFFSNAQSIFYLHTYSYSSLIFPPTPSIFSPSPPSTILWYSTSSTYSSTLIRIKPSNWPPSSPFPLVWSHPSLSSSMPQHQQRPSFSSPICLASASNSFISGPLPPNSSYYTVLLSFLHVRCFSLAPKQCFLFSFSFPRPFSGPFVLRVGGVWCGFGAVGRLVRLFFVVLWSRVVVCWGVLSRRLKLNRVCGETGRNEHVIELTLGSVVSLCYAF